MLLVADEKLLNLIKGTSRNWKVYTGRLLPKCLRKRQVMYCTVASAANKAKTARPCLKEHKIEVGSFFLGEKKIYRRSPGEELTVVHGTWNICGSLVF